MLLLDAPNQEAIQLIDPQQHKLRLDVEDPTWFEQLLVYGALHQWAGAITYLLDLIKAHTRQPLTYIARKIARAALRSSGIDEQTWINQEIEQTSSLILLGLLYGCTCWTCDGFSEKPTAARRRCQDLHSLSSWSRKVPLNDFLFTAIVSGVLRLGGPFQSEMNHVNGFRHGMLAKAVRVNDHPLVVSPVLTCHGCAVNGEVGVDDICTYCEKQPQSTDIKFYLWIDGQRQPRICRLCTRCNAYYFQYYKACPKCGAEGKWSQRTTTVWIRPFSTSHCRSITVTDDPYIHATVRESLARHLTTLPSPYKEAGTMCFLENKGVADIAHDLNISVSDVLVLLKEVDSMLAPLSEL